MSFLFSFLFKTFFPTNQLCFCHLEKSERICSCFSSPRQKRTVSFFFTPFYFFQHYFLSITVFSRWQEKSGYFSVYFGRPGESKHQKSALFYLKKIHQFFSHQERIRKTFTWKCFYCFDLNIVWKVCETGWM